MPSVIYPNRELTVLAAAARLSTFNGVDINQRAFRGIVLYIDVTVATGTTPTLNIDFQTKDPVSGFYVTHASFAEITAVTERTIIILPEIVESGSVRFSRVVGQTWRLVYTIGGTSPVFTFSVGGSYIP